jgi:hypothetical protein
MTYPQCSVTSTPPLNNPSPFVPFGAADLTVIDGVTPHPPFPPPRSGLAMMRPGQTKVNTSAILAERLSKCLAR